MLLKDALTPEMVARLREITNTLVERAKLQFREAVVPIYGSKANGRPVHIGSAVLLHLNGVKVLLTAAHIIDANVFTTLYVGSGKKLRPIVGEFTATGAPNGRDHDHYDFAFYEVPKELADNLDGRFIGLEEISRSARLDQGRYYTALGYPNSKNRKYDPLRNSVKARLFSYSSIHKVYPEVATKLPAAGEHHIFLTYDKRSRDNDGTVVDSTKLKGMSGGAVIDVGRPTDLGVFSSGELPAPLLAGIVIELKKEKVLLAVQMAVILPVMLAAFPEIDRATG
ncbi:trypsin-like peptidase domain-containing protein [Mesorhizobium sp. 128a]